MPNSAPAFEAPRLDGCRVPPTGIGVEGPPKTMHRDTHVLPHRWQGSHPQQQSITVGHSRVCQRHRAGSGVAHQHPVGSGGFSELTVSLIKRKGGEGRGENVSTKQPMPYGRNGICLLWHRAESDCNYSLLINSSVGESVREPINGSKRCSTEGSHNTGLQGATSSHQAQSPCPCSAEQPSVTTGRCFPRPSRTTSSKGGPQNPTDPAPQLPQQERAPTPSTQPWCKANPFPLALQQAVGKSNSLL